MVYSLRSKAFSGGQVLGSMAAVCLYLEVPRNAGDDADMSGHVLGFLQTNHKSSIVSWNPLNF